MLRVYEPLEMIGNDRYPASQDDNELFLGAAAAGRGWTGQATHGSNLENLDSVVESGILMYLRSGKNDSRPWDFEGGCPLADGLESLLPVHGTTERLRTQYLSQSTDVPDGSVSPRALALREGEKLEVC